METKASRPIKELIQNGDEGIALLEQLIAKPKDIIPKHAIWRKALRHPSSVTLGEMIMMAAVSGETEAGILDLLCRWVIADPHDKTAILLKMIRNTDLMSS